MNLLKIQKIPEVMKSLSDLKITGHIVPQKNTSAGGNVRPTRPIYTANQYALSKQYVY